MEIEAKLRARGPSVLDAIARLRRLGGYQLRPLARRDLETRYLDTSRRDLLRAGIAFRLRSTGDGVELTVKEAGSVAAGVHRRVESTWHRTRMPRFPLRRLPPALRDRLERWTGRRPLVPLVGTRIHRTVLLAHRRGGGRPVAEIDLDRVVFFHVARNGVPSEQSRPSYEVEIELLGGSEDDLARLVRGLRAHHDLRAAPLSKLARALRWASRAGRPTRRRTV